MDSSEEQDPEDEDEEDDGEILSDVDENSMSVLNQSESGAASVNGFPQVPYQAKRITCRLCNKRISTKTGLKKHMVLEHGMTGNLVGCTLCSAEFANDKGLKVHLFRSHKIREADYASVLPPELLDPASQQKRKLLQNLEELKMIEQNENGKADYECDICNLVCKNREELREHNRMVHAIEDDGELSDHLDAEDETSMSRVNSPAVGEVDELWYQCRYCNRSFNSSKKLTIHMHTHEAVDHTDYSCKDCGNVYASKKSLWVHRHKKHPRIPDPSQCAICKKTMFDKTELQFHLQTHSDDPYFNDLVENQNKETSFDPHLSLLSILDASLSNKQMDDQYKQQQLQRQQQIMSQQSKKRPLLANPTVKPDGSQEFACDMCPKTFPVANALQVHRGWHFRSPDGRKVKDPAQMWQPDQVPPSKVRRTGSSGNRAIVTAPVAAGTPPPPPVCEYCNSKFASYNNLRRHVIEVHKRHESRDNDEKISLDRVGECSGCSRTFGTLAEWVDHKIADARNKRLSTNYEWNCEICAKNFTRKERLLQHMLSHLNDREMDPEILAKHQARVAAGEIPEHAEEEPQDYKLEVENEQVLVYENQEQENDEEDLENDQDDLENDQEDLDNDQDIDNEDDEQELESDPDSDEEDQVKQEGVNCGLCHLVFKNSHELRAHVSEHFLNGGVESKPVKPSQDEAEENVEDEEEDDDDEELDELEEAYAELDGGSDADIDNVANEEIAGAEESGDEDDEEVELDEDSSQTSSSEKGHLQQDFAAISQEHKCRICQTKWPDQLRAISCMNSHLNAN